jgi:hypothetical protein
MRRAAAIPLLFVAVLGSAALLAASGSARDPALASTGNHPQYCPLHDHDGYNARRLIGKRLPRAREIARAHDCTARVVKRDGESLPVTEDFSWTRIDVAVNGGRVTGIDGVY